MASPLDMNKFTAKERNAARKELLKKIDGYNKQMRRTKEPSFPLSSPTSDLVYKGVIKFTYDRGYALQTKSTLVDSGMTTNAVIDRLIDSLGLTGDVEDYQLQEINHMTKEARTIGNTEFPLSIQLQYGPHTNALDLRLIQVKQKHNGGSNKERNNHQGETDSEEEEEDDVGDNRDVTPKDEVIDHGFANIEATMDEALEDIPSLVQDIQERLRLLSDVVLSPKMPLPPRRALWDKLKPQVSALVKDIRHLVDNGEFLATRHCPSDECRLIMTLLLELITDHSRELIVVTKEMCGLKGAARTDFSTSLNSFSQHISHISYLVDKMQGSLHAVALAGHLLHATAPENFIKGSLQDDSYFTGSGGVSGIIIFTTITAYLGLIRGAYEDKSDYYASLTSNMLQSGNKALETIQKTNEYELLHLHPLKSRVVDMEIKLKIAMDTLVKRVKAATSRRPTPISVPDMLLAGHALIRASLDFLMVAQCASLLHKVVIEGWEVLELPWVRGWVSTTSSKTINSRHQSDSDSANLQTTTTSYMTTDQISTSSDTATERSYGTATERSYGTASTASSGKKRSKERKSRIPTYRKGSTDGGLDTTEKRGTEETGVNFGRIALQPGSLPLHYGVESGEDADDEGGGSLTTNSRKTSSVNDPRSETDEESRSRSHSLRSTQNPVPPHFSEKDSTQYMGNAINILKQHHILNMAIARIAEGLLLSLTQKINLLSVINQDKSHKDEYSSIIEEAISIAKQIRDEVSSMECDVANDKSVEESLEQSRNRLQTVTRDVYLSLSSATSENATERDRTRLIASVSHLNTVSSKTVRDALNITKEHKRALVQAEKLEQEFVALVTGKKHTDTKSTASSSPTRNRRKISINVKLQSDNDAESVVLDTTISSKTLSSVGVWSPKTSPKVVGGTKTQLLNRLTYHKALDSEFITTFIIGFHKFIPTMDMLQFLVEKFCLNMPQDIVDDSDKEAFESEVAIPIRLRVIHALRLWIYYHPRDFVDDQNGLGQTLETFLQLIEESMPTCSRQLRALLKGNSSAQKINRITPQSILPLEPENGKKFDILDCNSLELARQLCIMYSNAVDKINLKEFLTIGLEPNSSSSDETQQRINNDPNIIKVKLISQQITRFITRRLLAETDEESQLIVLSYFIKTAESSLNLKNYEAVSAIYKGLTTDSVKGAISGAWRLLNEQELQAFRMFRELVLSDVNYHRYRMEQKKADQIPFVPLLGVFLQDISAINRDYPDYTAEKLDIINFVKWRCFAKLLIPFHQLKNYPYSLSPIQVIQTFLSMFGSPLTDQQWLELN